MMAFHTWTSWSFLWTGLFIVGPYIIKMSLFYLHRILVHLNCGVRFKPVMHHCVKILDINGGGVLTLNMLITFVNWYRSSCATYNKYVFVLTKEQFIIMNCDVGFESVMHHCIHISKNTGCGVPILTKIIIFVNSYISLVEV